ncbi:ficolin-1-like [Orbicella faveolata]|uniref:ficolin-1-like n=1 Tax=Orbicella faveolata TaxID=48498 RepID=UPI0009E1EC57|nr:ficolin-1-like [Orbicella faveolata]
MSGPCQNGGTCVSIYEKNSFVCLCAKGYTGSICQTVSKGCADSYKSGEKTNGVYTINPDGTGIIKVFCDQTTAGGGWLVFQKRLDGSVDFYRGWNQYKRGFGSPTGEFWLGLDNIHRLTSSGSYKLRVDLEDFAGNTYYAEYDFFKVASEGEKYKLSVGSYSGTAGDKLTYHNGQKFSTKDQDNDISTVNCAAVNLIRGAWWYGDCKLSNLNGVYRNGADNGTMVWDNIYPIKRAEMKIRPVDF